MIARGVIGYGERCALCKWRCKLQGVRAVVDIEKASAAARQIKKFLAASAIWALPTIALILSYLHDKIQNTQAWLNIRLCMLPTKYAIFSRERKQSDLTG